MDTFTYVPAWSSRVKHKPKILVAAFGDGYEQRVQKGINHDPQVWALSFRTDDTEADAIEDFLEGKGGTSVFLWQNPRGVTIKVRCADWSRNYNNHDDNLVRATFMQMFDNVQ